MYCTSPEEHKSDGALNELAFPAIMYNDGDLEQLFKEKSHTPSAQNESGNETCVVFLTGSTGFLGRHILLELLSSDLCDRVYCHVRGRSEGECVRGGGWEYICVCLRILWYTWYNMCVCLCLHMHMPVSVTVCECICL